METHAAPLPSSEIPADVKDTFVYHIISDLGNDEILTQQQLHDGILKTQRNEQQLLLRANNLKGELANQKEELKKSGTVSFEDSTTISSLRKELAKITSQLQSCNEREENERVEIAILENKKKNIENQVEADRKKKVDELEPKIKALRAATSDIRDEISGQKELILKLQQEKLESDRIIFAHMEQRQVTEDSISELRQEYTKIKMDPEKYRKQADVALATFSSIKGEADRLTNHITEQDNELNNQSKSRKEDLDVSMSLAVELDKYRNMIKKKEAECRDAMKDSELQQIRHREELENRARLELELKRAAMKIRRKNEESLGKERDTIKALKGVRRAKIEELKREVEKEKGATKKQHEMLEDSRCENYILISSQLHQEELEASAATQLRQLLFEVEEDENELNRLMKQEMALNRLTSDLSVERDMKRNESTRADGNFEKARKDLKLKNLVIVDLERSFSETDSHLKKYEELYEIVKNERNRYMSTLQATQLLGSELSEKIKILQNEIDLLQRETETKDKVLSQERTTYQMISSERDAARGEINKANYICQLKEEGVEQGMAETRKLNAIIKSAETDMLEMRRKYENGLDTLNSSGIQLVRINEELVQLYQRSNIQENSLRIGEVEYKKREEEIRILTLHISELEREILVARKQEFLIPKLQQEKEELLRLLYLKQRETRQLSSEIESPENGRWRTLSGKDATVEELEVKIRRLDERINEAEKQDEQKSQILSKAKSTLEKKIEQLNAAHEGASQLATKINDYKSRIKKINRKTQAVLAQISLHQMNAIQNAQEKMQLHEDLQGSTQRFEAGEAPTVEADRKWQQLETMKKLKALENDRKSFEENNPQHSVSMSGFRSQAEARPNLYIPEGDLLEIPKPFVGNALPFKPSVSGANRRHFKPPAEREIEL